jgi:hypothetical protein
MDEKLVLWFWFFGGFVVAFFCLLIATFLAAFAQSLRILKWFCLTAAFCGLIYEGGCFAVASDIGRATGGGGDDGTLRNIVGIAFLIAIVWSVVILLLSSAGKDKQVVDEKS